MPITAARPASPTLDRRRRADAAEPPRQAPQGPQLAQVGPSELRHSKVKPAELIPFVTQLAVMLDSGVILSEALDAIAEQAAEGTFRDIVLEITDTVKTGEPFSKALSRYPRVFSPMFISMVKASEASGRMVEMLTVVTGYITFESETVKKIKGALTYPLIMAAMAVGATATLMFFVLPRFMKIYEAKGAALPKLTQIIVSLSALMTDPKSMTAIITGLVGLGVAVYYYIHTEHGVRTVDYLKIRTPVLGTMFVDTVITRSTRILATMLNTGVSLLDAIEVIAGSTRNYYFSQLWAAVDKRIRDGYQLSDAIQLSCGQNLIAPGVIQMLRAGEKSGKLGEVCTKVSDFYEKKLEASIKNVMTLIEPLMITVLGGVIGTIAIALLLPVFRISSVVAH
ncbi:MAG TPA: type II secretion system F family protein [Phycisphaerales bacterium]|nr:type II secretion system F family protein [Phycisphaerales bacterium]